MGNYKQDDAIIVGGVKTTVPTSDLVLSLTEQTQGSGSADAMQLNSALYQVPTGKTFKLLGIRVWLNGTGGGTLAIYQADTEDATTTLKLTVDLPFITSGVLYEISGSKSFNASKFITIVPSTTTVLHTVLIGAEVSA